MFSQANLKVRAQQIEQDYPDKLGTASPPSAKLV